jgi:hypothetical protein
MTITSLLPESRKKFNEDGYDRHKIFLYKEDFNKFLKALTEAVDYVKTDLMPDFDFDAYNHDQVPEQERNMKKIQFLMLLLQLLLEQYLWCPFLLKALLQVKR